MFVEGNQQHGFVESNVRPVKQGGVASITTPSAVTNGATVNAYYDQFGRLHVSVDSATLDSSYAEDSTHVSGDKGQFVLGVRSDTLTAFAGNGDYIPFSMDALGRLRVANTEYGPDNLPNLYFNILGVFDIPSCVIADPVNLAVAQVVTTGVNVGELTVGGGVAHDSANVGNPLQVGGHAYSGTPTDVTDGDRVRGWFNLKGALGIHDAGGSITIDGSLTNISGTISLPTGAATAANQTTMITALQIIDNIPHSNNAAFSNGVPIMGQMDDTGTTAATENNVSAIRITAQRAMHSYLVDVQGTAVAHRPNLAVGAGLAIGGDDIAGGGFVVAGSQKSYATSFSLSGANPLNVVAVDYHYNGSTNIIGRGDATGGKWVQGGAAHDAVDSGNPNKVGGYASRGVRTAVNADADRTDASFDLNGRQRVATQRKISTAVAALTADGDVIAASASNVHQVFCLSAYNKAATAVQIDIKNGSGGAILHSFYLGAAGSNSSSVENFQHLYLETSTNTALYADLTGAALDVIINAKYLTNPGEI